MAAVISRFVSLRTPLPMVVQCESCLAGIRVDGAAKTLQGFVGRSLIDSGLSCLWGCLISGGLFDADLALGQSGATTIAHLFVVFDGIAGGLPS